MILEDSEYLTNHPMTHADALYRDSIISEPHYDVNLLLPKGEEYCGHITITFKLFAEPTKNVHLDFRGTKIANLNINGVTIQDDTVFKKHQIKLPYANLKLGVNKVNLRF